MRQKFRHAEELKTLRSMIEMLEEDITLGERHAYSPYIDEISRWVWKRPTLCHGVDLKTVCGRPQLEDEHGRKTTTSLCEKCLYDYWKTKPPSLSKHEQKTIDKIEELHQQLSAGGISLEDFAKAMRPLRKRSEGKDSFLFHRRQIDEKYNSRE